MSSCVDKRSRLAWCVRGESKDNGFSGFCKLLERAVATWPHVGTDDANKTVAKSAREVALRPRIELRLLPNAEIGDHVAEIAYQFEPRIACFIGVGLEVCYSAASTSTGACRSELVTFK